MVAEVLVVGTEGDEILQVCATHANLIAVVVFVGRPLAHHGLLGQADAKANGLALVADGVFLGDGPVGSPAASQAVMVGVFLGVLHVDDAR